MKQKNSRGKSLYSNKIRVFYVGYIIITLILTLIGASSIVPSMFPNILGDAGLGGAFSMNLPMHIFLFILWIVYGFFVFYNFHVARINGLVFRLETVFDKVAAGHVDSLTFRDKDPFHPVAESFNKMLKSVSDNSKIKSELEEFSQSLEGENKVKLDIIIGNLI